MSSRTSYCTLVQVLTPRRSLRPSPPCGRAPSWGIDKSCYDGFVILIARAFSSVYQRNRYANAIRLSSLCLNRLMPTAGTLGMLNGFAYLPLAQQLTGDASHLDVEIDAQMRAQRMSPPPSPLPVYSLRNTLGPIARECLLAENNDVERAKVRARRHTHRHKNRRVAAVGVGGKGMRRRLPTTLCMSRGFSQFTYSDLLQVLRILRWSRADFWRFAGLSARMIPNRYGRKRSLPPRIALAFEKLMVLYVKDRASLRKSRAKRNRSHK